MTDLAETESWVSSSASMWWPGMLVVGGEKPTMNLVEPGTQLMTPAMDLLSAVFQVVAFVASAIRKQPSVDGGDW